jgi:hypothetical protein
MILGEHHLEKCTGAKGNTTFICGKKFSLEIKQDVITNDTLELPYLCAKFDLDVR